MVKASCPSHPSRAAVAVCGRCGRFLCGDCLELAGEVSLCLECHGRGQGGSASRRATASLVLGILGLTFVLLPVLVMNTHIWPLPRGLPPPILALPCALLAGIAGIFLGTRELSAIGRGNSPRSGASRARVGRLLGALTLGLPLAMLVAFALQR